MNVWRVAVVIIFVALCGLFLAIDIPSAPLNTQGFVTDAHGPVAGSTVRWQGAKSFTVTDSHGRFALRGPHRQRRVTASKSGFVIAAGDHANPHLRLLPIPEDDNDEYAWIDPSPDPKQPLQCANCHEQIHREWSDSAHGGSAKNRKFLNLFAGDIAPLAPQGIGAGGAIAPLSLRGRGVGGAIAPLSPRGRGVGGEGPPASSWNLLKEYPLGSGVCATCHAPTLASTSPDLDYDVRHARGVHAHGVHCDYCHKIAEAPTDKLGTRFGRDGYRLVRPKPGEQIFFGPLDDAVRTGDSFVHAPFYKESRYCASCHEGVVFGVHVYGTYSEWLDSPAKRKGQQCQDCHMTPTGTLTNIAPGKGGVERDPQTLASHAMPGGTIEMLRKSLDLDVQTAQQRQNMVVTVTTRAHDVGHRVPTGFIDRHLILVVEGDSNALHLRDGPVLPARAGPKFAGRPGWIYGKQHLNAAGAPVPFWLTADELRDTRLAPEVADVRSFTFAGDAASIRIRLIYRRFWTEVASARGWTDNDLLVMEKTVKGISPNAEPAR